MKNILAIAAFFWLISFNVVHAQGTRIVDLPAQSSPPSTFIIPGAATSGASVKTITLANVATYVASANLFNFSQPSAKTVAVSTSYQAADPTKAAIIYPSFACQNATTVIAASGCTLTVRVGTGTLTCGTGTVLYTQSLTVSLGLLITQNSTNPAPIHLPIGASFIVCASVGTFTITAVEQSAG